MRKHSLLRFYLIPKALMNAGVKFCLSASEARLDERSPNQLNEVISHPANQAGHHLT
jgi:hypothetical protein